MRECAVISDSVIRTDHSRTPAGGRGNTGAITICVVRKYLRRLRSVGGSCDGVAPVAQQPMPIVVAGLMTEPREPTGTVPCTRLPRHRSLETFGRSQCEVRRPAHSSRTSTGFHNCNSPPHSGETNPQSCRSIKQNGTPHCPWFSKDKQ
jgi:hypothetical protein